MAGNESGQAGAFQQKGVVPPLGFDLTEAHILARTLERLHQLARSAFNLRDRMSADNWRTLNRLIADPVFQRGSSLPLALGWLDRAVTTMMTLSGYVLDGVAIAGVHALRPRETEHCANRRARRTSA